MTSPLQSPEDVVEWIDACVLGDLRTLIRGIDAYLRVAGPFHGRWQAHRLGQLPLGGWLLFCHRLSRTHLRQQGLRRSEGDSLHRHFPRANQSALWRGWPPDLEVLPTRDRARQLAETHRLGERHCGSDHGRRQRGVGPAPVSVSQGWQQIRSWSTGDSCCLT